MGGLEKSVPSPDDADFSVFDEDTKELLDEVYAVFGPYSVWKLANMTHEEPPWRETNVGGTIDHRTMTEYCKTQLTDE